ncbi:hypothetical protein D3C72_2565160 [compost metagenome]
MDRVVQAVSHDRFEMVDLELASLVSLRHANIVAHDGEADLNNAHWHDRVDFAGHDG